MEENKAIEAVVTETTSKETGELEAKAEVKPGFLKRCCTAIWNNRGKLGVALGAGITIGLSALLGGKSNE